MPTPLLRQERQRPWDQQDAVAQSSLASGARGGKLVMVEDIFDATRSVRPIRKLCCISATHDIPTHQVESRSRWEGSDRGGQGAVRKDGFPCQDPNGIL